MDFGRDGVLETTNDDDRDSRLFFRGPKTTAHYHWVDIKEKAHTVDLAARGQFLMTRGELWEKKVWIHPEHKNNGVKNITNPMRPFEPLRTSVPKIAPALTTARVLEHASSTVGIQENRAHKRSIKRANFRVASSNRPFDKIIGFSTNLVRVSWRGR